MHLPDDVSSIYFSELLPPKAHQVLLSVAFDQTISTIADKETPEPIHRCYHHHVQFSDLGYDQEATSSDNNMVQLTKLIESGFVQHLDELPEALRPYHQYRSDLSTLDGVVIFKDRIVIPPSLRNIVLDNLHAAYQRTNSMVAHAEYAVFPNYTTNTRIPIPVPVFRLLLLHGEVLPGIRRPILQLVNRGPC